VSVGVGLHIGLGLGGAVENPELGVGRSEPTGPAQAASPAPTDPTTIARRSVRLDNAGDDPPAVSSRTAEIAERIATLGITERRPESGSGRSMVLPRRSLVAQEPLDV